MRKAGLVVWWLVGTACGRLGFGSLEGGGDASGLDTGLADTIVNASLPPSCMGLAATCGPTGTSSCCTSPLVPGGMFDRGYDVGSDSAYPDMTHPATISDFRLDTYEVTVGRFRQFVSAGQGTQAHPPGAGAGARTLGGVANQGGWDPTWNASLPVDTAALIATLNCSAQFQSWTDTAGANESLPIECLTWFDAMAFCIWDGGFLPTEAEWNYAAAGGSEQRAYPWSVPANSLTIDCSYSNFYTGTAQCVNPPNGAVNRVGSESPKGDGKWGQADLSGNVWEWTLDWVAAFADPCNDCADLTPATYRQIRGGDYSDPAISLRGAGRGQGIPNSGAFFIGMRCARIP